MNRILRIDEEKPEMHITVQDYMLRRFKLRPPFISAV